ncbi:MAG: GNAT family N-acetyltransferase [Candidatus Nanohaloarchaea archaeon]|nr:GNAT family N-acetyltransferase [Candidatus Nanohaloarchaea archaeon]
MEVDVREISVGKAEEVHRKIPEFDPSYIEENFEDRVRGNDELILGGFIDGDIAGYLIAYDRDHDGSYYCWMAGTEPEHRRKGVLSALMDSLEDYVSGRGYGVLKVKTRNKHRGMLHLLLSQDFNIADITPAESIEETEIHLRKTI